MKAKGEEDKKPVILAITILQEEFEDWTIFQDDNEVPLEGDKPPMRSWYFTDTVPIKYIEIAHYGSDYFL